MDYKTDIRPISYIKTHAADILKQINETHRPIVITQNGEAKGIFVDTESYENMQKSIQMLKLISLAENDIINNRVHSSDEVFDKLEKKFNLK